jgi:hypothetical protein
MQVNPFFGGGQESPSSGQKPKETKPKETEPEDATPTPAKVKTQEELKIVEDADPNPGKTPLERLLWAENMTQYYKKLSDAGYDKSDLSKLEQLAADKKKFEARCKKVSTRHPPIGNPLCPSNRKRTPPLKFNYPEPILYPR